MPTTSDSPSCFGTPFEKDEEILVDDENREYIFKKIDKYTYGNRNLPIILFIRYY